MKMKRTPSASRPRGARFPEGVGAAPRQRPPKMSLTSFLAASSTYFWK